MRTNVSLRSTTARRWEDVRDELEDRLGYRPDHAETARLLMAGFDPDQVMQSDDSGLM
jgi:hypothetical protein